MLPSLGCPDTEGIIEHSQQTPDLNTPIRDKRKQTNKYRNIPLDRFARTLSYKYVNTGAVEQRAQTNRSDPASRTSGHTQCLRCTRFALAENSEVGK